MSKLTINVGSTANDKQGDSLRGAFQKVNANFTELYTALGLNADTTLNLGAFEFSGSTMSTTDSTAIKIDQAVVVSSNLTVDGNSYMKNLRQVSSTDGLKPVYFDPVTGELVVLI